MLLACPTSTSIIQTSAAFLLEKLDSRFPITENMIVATFLDPSMQKLPLIYAYCQANSVDMVELLMKKWYQYRPELRVQKALPNQKALPAPAKPSPVAKLRIELIQKHVATTNNNEEGGLESNMHQEYLKYTAISNLTDDPLIWWKTHEAAFPYLSALARVMLSIPSSSGATETHFSDSGYLITKKKLI